MCNTCKHRNRDRRVRPSYDGGLFQHTTTFLNRFQRMVISQGCTLAKQDLFIQRTSPTHLRQKRSWPSCRSDGLSESWMIHNDSIQRTRTPRSRVVRTPSLNVKGKLSNKILLIPSFKPLISQSLFDDPGEEPPVSSLSGANGP